MPNMSFKNIACKAAAICVALMWAIPALANEPRLVAKYNDWSTYTRIEGNEKICYVLAKPRSKRPTSVRHGDIYFMVSNWRSGQATEQPSLLTGYPLHGSHEPLAIIGNARQLMFSDQNEAFIEADDSERRLVRNMKAGSTLKVSAMSKRGTKVNYEFSLKGVTAALKRARDNCR